MVETKASQIITVVLCESRVMRSIETGGIKCLVDIGGTFTT